MIELPYGRVPYPLALEAASIPTRDLTVIFDDALAAPLIQGVVRSTPRATITVSVATRRCPDTLTAIARVAPPEAA